MMNRTLTGLVLLVLTQGVAGCGDSSSKSAPSAPSPVPQPGPQLTSIQLTGFVFDTANRALPGARVEVLNGPQAGTSTSADPHGAFALTGFFDDTTQFRASNEGHIAATQTFNSIATRKAFVFTLESLAASVNLAGDYTVTFMADSACTDFPNELRTRTYAATITPDTRVPRPTNTLFNAALSGASLDTYFNRFSIFVAGDFLVFDLSDNDVVEEVAEETYLTIGGYGSASVGASGVSTVSVPFQGVFEYCVVKSDAVPGSYYRCVPTEMLAHAECRSKTLQLVLTRR